MKRFFFFRISVCCLCFLAAIPSAPAQIYLSGVVHELHSELALPYSSIGIRNKNTGTCADAEGRFWITLPVENEQDTLSFSHPGYEDFSLSVQRILSSQRKTISLPKKPAETTGIAFSTKRTKEYQYGFTNDSLAVPGVTEVNNKDDVYELVQFIPGCTQPSKITSVNLFLHEAREDSGLFRIQFYSWNGKMPGRLLIAKEILHKQPVRAGWMKFDLQNENVIVQDSFLVSITMIPDFKENLHPLMLETIPGSMPGTFFRSHSFGQWEQPSWHYRMYITTLAKKEKKKKHSRN